MLHLLGELTVLLGDGGALLREVGGGALLLLPGRLLLRGLLDIADHDTCRNAAVVFRYVSASDRLNQQEHGGT